MNVLMYPHLYAAHHTILVVYVVVAHTDYHTVFVVYSTIYGHVRLAVNINLILFLWAASWFLPAFSL